MKHHNGRAVKAGSEWGTAFRRPRGVTNNKTETAAGTLAGKVDDLGGKSIPSAPINPLLCLIVQMAGQEFVINVDQSVQVSTALLSGCGAPAPQLPPSGGALLWTHLSLFHPHAAGTQVRFARLNVFFFSWKEVLFFLGGFYTLVVTHGTSRHLWDQREHRFLSINEPNVSKL